jgi:hypothetical protein
MTIKSQNKNEPKVKHSFLTRRDVRDLLFGYSGAIALDQIRVDYLPPGSFHKEYNRGMWKRYRTRHLQFINHLMVSLEQIPKGTLCDLTMLATRRKTRTVRKAMVDLLSIGATNSYASGQVDSAPLFFSFLVREVGCGLEDDRGDGFSQRIMRWLKPIDPLGIAEDPECGYMPALQSRVLYGF